MSQDTVINFPDRRQQQNPAYLTENIIIEPSPVQPLNDILSRAHTLIDEFDKEHVREWKKEAQDMFAFRAGDQWSQQDRDILRGSQRPVLTFNRIGPIIDAVTGTEILNRYEITVKPVGTEDSFTAEIGSKVIDHERDQVCANDEESAAFDDMLVCGMGWTDDVMCYEDPEFPEGKATKRRLDPLNMAWDWSSNRRNIVDSKWRAHRQRYSLEEFKDMYPHVDPPVTTDTRDDMTQPYRRSAGDQYSDPSPTSGKPADEKRPYEVTQFQWWEYQIQYLVMRPWAPQMGPMVMSEDEWMQNVQDPAEKSGNPLPDHQILRRKMHFQMTFIGYIILDGPSFMPDGYSLNCMTGKYDRNRSMWYGLVRGMKDPQEWANKFLSALQTIMATAGKGIIAEADAFEDMNETKANWANPQHIAVSKKGAVSQGKIMPKPTTPVPPGLENLLQFAVMGIPATSGINLEFLGFANRQQAPGVEESRKDSGYTILGSVFNSLRQYRMTTGRLWLRYIIRYYPPQKIAQIVGPELAQHIPEFQSPNTLKFNVVIDDVPVSANQKDKIWQTFAGMMPALSNIGAPPGVYVAMLDYAPLPASVIKQLKQAIMPPPDPERQRKIEEAERLARAKDIADIGETQSKTIKNLAEAGEAEGSAEKDRATAAKALVEALMTPLEVSNQNARTND